MRIRTALLLTLAAFSVAACTYRGDPANPAERNLTWFSYLNGDDMRPACGPGAPDRYRLVYNGIYTEQVRSYDVTAASPEHPGRIESRVFGSADLNRIKLSGPMNLFDPWRGQSASRPLASTELDRLAETLGSDLDGQPLDGRLELPSDSFYWIVAACIDGEFRFDAFRWPSPRFAALHFPELVLSWDRTGVPLNPPREVDPVQLYGALSGEEIRNANRFNIAAEHDGLVGHFPFF